MKNQFQYRLFILAL